MFPLGISPKNDPLTGAGRFLVPKASAPLGQLHDADASDEMPEHEGVEVPELLLPVTLLCQNFFAKRIRWEFAFAPKCFFVSVVLSVSSEHTYCR